MPLLAIALALASAPLVPGPAFECARAALPAERAICADARLAAWDRAVAALYRAGLARRGRGGAAPAQRSWLAKRNRCAAPACLAQRYEERFLELAGAGDMDAQMLRSEADRDAFLQIAPIGGGWFMFHATDIWTYPGGDNANDAQSGGIFRLEAGTGRFEDGSGCTLRFKPLPRRRWQLTEPEKAAGRPCGGGLNTGFAGLYGPEK